MKSQKRKFPFDFLFLSYSVAIDLMVKNRLKIWCDFWMMVWTIHLFCLLTFCVFIWLNFVCVSLCLHLDCFVCCVSNEETNSTIYCMWSVVLVEAVSFEHGVINAGVFFSFISFLFSKKKMMAVIHTGRGIDNGNNNNNKNRARKMVRTISSFDIFV